MKRLFTLLILISAIGGLVLGCDTNGKTVLDKVVESKMGDIEDLKEMQSNEDNNKEIEEAGIKDLEQKEDIVDSKYIENITNEEDEYPDDVEKVLRNFVEAMRSGDIEKASEYVLYADLEAPFSPLKDNISSYKEILTYDIQRITDEVIPEDFYMLRIYMNTSKGEVSDNILLKNVDDTWYIANQGVVLRYQSIYADDQVPDGECGIYLKNVYRYFTGYDLYVISIVNNTNEKLYIGFINNTLVIYENEEGKNTIQMDNRYEINPYNKDYVYFHTDSSKGQVKSIALTEVMLGLKASTSDVKVSIGEMIVK